jgi:uncharacterized protein YcbK (DUF882 family)
MIEMKYFKPEEFTMAGKVVFDQMDAGFLAKLDACREAAGVGFTITSSYRSPEHNRRVGGSPRSMHLKGRAVDIRVSDGAMRWAVIKAAIGLGLTVGVMRDALHLDDREGPIVFHYYKTIPAGPSGDE